MTAYPVLLTAWAERHGVSPYALAELAAISFSIVQARTGRPSPSSESGVAAGMRLDEAQAGACLFRNNVGVLRDERGRPVRFGLANETAALNKDLKSSDYIGWKSLQVTPAMVGQRIAQFRARECKRPGWTYRGDAREKAQLNFINLVNADGGDAKFVTSETP